MTSMEVAEKTGLPIGQVKNLLLSYRNRYHASPLVRAGARIELSEKGYSLTTCEADAAAKRPLRGLKVNKAAKPAKRIAKTTIKTKRTTASKPRKPKATPAAAVAPAPIPSDSETPESAANSSAN